MPRGRNKQFSLSGRNLYIAIAAAVVLIALIVILCIHPWSSSDAVAPAATTAPTEEVIIPDETAEAEPTLEPTPAPTPGLATPKPVDTSKATLPKNAAGYLPVFENNASATKRIAITVDDLWQEENVQKILTVCKDAGAKLTFFPIGEAVLEDAAILKRIHEDGHEIENHTYNHVNLYSLTTEKMVEQLTMQNKVINEALGVDYQMHFLRPRGGNGLYDQRMHNMLSQLGYVGVAHWSLSGTPDMNTWIKKLKDGDVILFHATDKDLAKLVKLIPALVQNGYELVTLNTLFGLPENETYPLGSTTIATLDGLDLTAMEENVAYIALSSGDCSYAVQRLQQRLKDLGYYSIECDGEYGTGTVNAVTAFQTAAGLTADGIAGTKTQSLLFSDDAPIASNAK